MHRDAARGAHRPRRHQPQRRDAARSWSAPRASMAVVKANGYGHGAVPVARAALAGGADWLGVVDLDEALELRARRHRRARCSPGCTTPTRDFDAGGRGGHRPRGELPRRSSSAAAAASGPRDRAAQGRHRAQPQRRRARASGPRSSRARPRIERRRPHPWCAASSATSRTRGEPTTTAQLARFDDASLAAAAAAGLDPELRPPRRDRGPRCACPPRASTSCASASASTASRRSTTSTSAVLGLRPGDDARGAGRRRSSACPPAPASRTATTTAPTRETTLALVPLGYADGIPRHASGRGPVAINGATLPVAAASRWTSSSSTSATTPVAVGDRACCSATPRRACPRPTTGRDAADTINYEIVTRIGPRVPRSGVRAIDRSIDDAARPWSELGARLAARAARRATSCCSTASSARARRRSRAASARRSACAAPCTSPTFVLARTHPRASGVAARARRRLPARQRRRARRPRHRLRGLDRRRRVGRRAQLDGITDDWLELDIERPHRRRPGRARSQPRDVRVGPRIGRSLAHGRRAGRT